MAGRWWSREARARRAEQRAGERIRRRGVAAARVGRRILFDGRAGRIVGFDPDRDWIIATVRQLDGRQVTMTLHPTRWITYLSDGEEHPSGWIGGS